MDSGSVSSWTNSSEWVFNRYKRYLVRCHAYKMTGRGDWGVHEIDDE